MNRSFVLRAAFSAAIAAAFALCDLPGRASDVKEAGASATPTEVEGRISKLIEQLGAEDFAARERAQAELAQLGLEAFDALHAAQNHHDPEIALRARYLVRSMNVRWFSETDSPEAVRILQGYGDLQEAERRNRMDRLAMLENRQGVIPLCRLSRYETNDPLAKYAALKVMGSSPPDEAAKAELVKAMLGIVGNTKRPAASWLRLFARTLSDPIATLAEWDQATQAEHTALAKTPERTSAEIVRDFYRFQVELLKRLKRDDDAIAVIRRTFTLLDGTPEQVLEIVDWLIQKQAWPVVLEVAKKFSATFDDNPKLLYYLAETYQKLGQNDDAEKAVVKAIAIRPENLDGHLIIGFWLEHERSQGTWAEREYREVLKTATPGSAADLAGRSYLSELLHDQGHELPAAKALEPLCELLKKDEAARERANRATGEIVARMHYFYACHYREQADVAQERTHLKAAVEADPTHADVLIAIYRFAGADDAWRANIKERIEKVAADLHAELDDARRAMEANPGDQNFPASNIDLARLCNEYAWLVGNTFGDYDEAVKLSRKSLELRPNYAGFLDTLGRCYYAKGDLINAVKYQAQAVKLNSYSGQIRRQLEFFIKEAKDRGVNLPAADSPPVAQAAPGSGRP